MGDCSRSNIVESGVISCWFGIHWTISHFFGDISVILDLWGCSWGLSGFPSNKSRLLTCLIGNLELLCMQGSGIDRRLSQRGKSHGFSQVAVGNWGIFSSYGGDGHSKLTFFQGSWIGHFSVHFTWSKKHSVPLTYIFLRENSSWVACGKLAYLFSRRQGISSHLHTIWFVWNFPPLALLKLMFHYTWDGCVRESLNFPKGCQATCCIWCGTRDVYKANAG